MTMWSERSPSTVPFSEHEHTQIIPTSTLTKTIYKTQPPLKIVVSEYDKTSYLLLVLWVLKPAEPHGSKHRQHSWLSVLVWEVQSNFQYQAVSASL